MCVCPCFQRCYSVSYSIFLLVSIIQLNWLKLMKFSHNLRNLYTIANVKIIPIESHVCYQIGLFTANVYTAFTGFITLILPPPPFPTYFHRTFPVFRTWTHPSPMYFPIYYLSLNVWFQNKTVHYHHEVHSLYFVQY